MRQNACPAHPQSQGHAEVLCVSAQNRVLFADPQPGGAPGRRTGMDKSLWPTEVTSLAIFIYHWVYRPRVYGVFPGDSPALGPASAPLLGESPCPPDLWSGDPRVKLF